MIGVNLRKYKEVMLRNDQMSLFGEQSLRAVKLERVRPSDVSAEWERQCGAQRAETEQMSALCI